MEILIPISIIFDTLLKTNVEDDQHPFEKRTKIFPTSILWFHLGFRTSTTCNEHCDVVQKKPQVHAMIISALSSASWYCIVMKLGVVPSTYIYPLVKQMLPWKIRMFLGKDDQTWLILKRPLYIYIYICQVTWSFTPPQTFRGYFWFSAYLSWNIEEFVFFSDFMI